LNNAEIICYFHGADAKNDEEHRQGDKEVNNAHNAEKITTPRFGKEKPNNELQREEELNGCIKESS
jgi:hypothetical protein